MSLNLLDLFCGGNWSPRGVSWHWAVLTWGCGMWWENFSCPFQCILGLLWWLKWLRLCLQCRRSGFYLCQEDPLEEWQPYSVFLPGEISGQQETGGLPSMMVSNWTGLSDFSLSLQVHVFYVNSGTSPLDSLDFIQKILLSVNYYKNWWHVRGWHKIKHLFCHILIMTKLVWQKFYNKPRELYNS